MANYPFKINITTKDNIKIIRKYGYKIIGPEIGDMACGEYGEGKMSEPIDIYKRIYNFLLNKTKNKKSSFELLENEQ